MMINMRSWILRKPIQIVFVVIIVSLSAGILLINTGETTSDFIPLPSKRVNHQIPKFKNFSKSIRIRLASGEFDPLIQAKPDKMTTERSIKKYSGRQERYYIVQFDGPLKDSQKYELEDLGAQVFDYLPDFSFIVNMDDTVHAMVQSMDSVRWIGTYQPAYKIKPTITEALSTGRRLLGAEYIVTLFKGENLQAVVQQIEQLGGEVLDLSSHGSRGKIKIRSNAQQLEFVTAIGGVKWIEPAPAWKLSNNVAAGIVDAYDVWNTHNLYGAGQTVAVADTGLDQGSTSPDSLHDDFEDGTGFSRVSTIFDRVGDGGNDVRSGHGTHVAGSVLGNGALSGSDPAASDYSNSDSYIGIAPEANLVFQAIEDNNTGSLIPGIPLDLEDLFDQAYNAGAMIHTNSWGAPDAGGYTSFSEDVDQFTWDNKNFLILFAAGNDGVDADGDGVIDLNSMQTPATAKNCITVGVTENNRPSGSSPTPGYNSTWVSLWTNEYAVTPIAGDHVSDDEDGMAAFSSRGPCLDGRIKPDIVAPGTNIVSTKSTATTRTLWGQGPDLRGMDYTFSGGTSMSTPLVAGAAILVHEYYTDIEGITPSAALIKATLLNGAASITPGQYGTGASQEIPNPPRPNNVEGWGRLDLENSIFPVPPKVLRYEDEAGGLTTGESVAYDFTAADGSEPLKATLVWTDSPGSPAAGGGLVNDLDFSIIGPSATVYYSNNASQRGKTEVIFYDDGLPEIAWTWTPGNRVGVRFTPTSYPAKLDKAIFALASFNDSYPNTFSFYVYNGSNSTGPQSVLASGTTTIRSSGWHVVDLSDFDLDISSGDFFLAIQLNADLVWFDDDTNPQERSWDYANDTWIKWTTGNYMFRAVVVTEDNITSYDRINNAVGIDVSNPAVGSYSIYVEGYNVPQGPQPYALVVSGGELSNMTKRFPPTSPEDVTAFAVSSADIELTWSDRSTNEDGFIIEKKDSNGNTYSQIVVGQDVENYNDTGLSEETIYYYRVRAYSNNNNEGNSSYFNETNVTIHAAPSDLSAAAVSDSRINLSWSDNSSYESGYEIWRRVGEDVNHSRVATVDADMTSYMDTHLSSSTSYYYLVRAISTNSGSDFSNEANINTLAASASSGDGGGGGGGGGGGVVCFIATSGCMAPMEREIMVTLLILGFGIIGLAGLQKRFRNPH
jgi:hypothetical protein